MAAAVELATAYISIAAEGSSLAPSFGRSFKAVEKVADDSGKRMGKSLTNQIAKATEADVEKAKNAYDQASKKVTRTVEQQALKVEAAKRKEEIAQARVVEAQAKAEAALAGVADAQKRAAAAQEAHGRESEQALTAQKKLTAEQAKYESGTTRVLSAQDQLVLASQKVEAAQRGQESATEKANRELAETERQLRDTERAADSAAQPFMTLGDRVKSAFRGDFKSAFRNVERYGEDAAEEIERDFKRSGDDSARGFGGNFKAGIAGALGGLATYVGLSEVIDLGKFSISGAADLEQSIGGVTTVFKDSADQMLAWSDAADQSLGLTNNEYNEYAARLGASLKNAGTPMEELGVTTNDLITKGADLASLYGGTTAEAVDALGSALRGEMDPIERYGITLNDAALTAEGLALGIEKTGGSFTTQEKQLLTLSLLQKQSADATGNFAAEQDTASNVAQRLTAKAKEMATEFGANLTPVLAGLGGWLLDKGIPALESFGNGIEGVWTLLTTGEFTGAENLFGFEEDSAFVTFLFDVRDGILGIWNGIQDWISSDAGQQMFGTIRDIGMEVWENVLKPLGEWFMREAPQYIPTIMKIVGAFAAVAAVLIGAGIVGALVAFGGQVAITVGFILPLLERVVNWLVEHAWPVIKDVLLWIGDAALWLYENAIKPAWAWIKQAIAAVVDWLVNSAWPFIKQVWDAITLGAQTLWGWITTTWNGIKAVIGAVVGWLQTWVWPVIQLVLELIKLGFNVMRAALKTSWDFIKNQVIAPVISWFRDTAWPIISSVIDSIKTGFDVMKSAIDTAWTWVKDKVINPVATWFRDTIEPLFGKTTDAVGSSFDTLKEAISKAWNSIKETAKAPVRFVVDTIVNDALIGNFNKLADKLGTTKLPEVSLPAGFARGGVLPGMSRLRDGDDQLVPMRRGEGVLVSEALKDPASRSLVYSINAAALRGGASLSSFLGGGFAGGGIFDDIKDFAGDTWDAVTSGAEWIARALTDPKAAFSSLVDGLVSRVPGGGLLREAAIGVPKRLGSSIAEKVLGAFGAFDGSGGSVPQHGSAGTGWARASSAAAELGLTMTSAYRPGSRTAGSGSVSLHAQNRARDYAGPAWAMRAFFNLMDASPYPTELLYTPMYGRNIHRGGQRYANTGATASNHYDHVHVGFAGGGVFDGAAQRSWPAVQGFAGGGIINGRIFDTGGVLSSGSFALNLSGQPEVVLDPAESRAYAAGQASTGTSGSSGSQVVGLSDETMDRLAEIISQIRLIIGDRDVAEAMARAEARYGGRR